MNAYIFDIKHFAVHDGPGIRTTLFFKGCPLNCIWCHNPESRSKNYQLAYYEHKCIECRRCASVCENGVHLFENGHILLRESCIHCGKCEKACNSGALILYGKDISIDEAYKELVEDLDFYGETGGVTLSGGECLMQADFSRELLKRLKEEGINTAVDTSGFVTQESIDKVLPYTDLFLFDIKAFKPETHKMCTDATNENIIKNLHYIDSRGAKIEIRIPLVPEYNLQEIAEIGGLLSSLSNLTGVRVLPYHKFASSKYKSLDMTNTMPDVLPSEKDIKKAEEILRSLGLNVLS